VRGVNDRPEDIEALIEALRPMRIDRIQLNTVVRPPAEQFALPVSSERLTTVARALHQALALPVDLPFVAEAEGTAPLQVQTDETAPHAGCRWNISGGTGAGNCRNGPTAALHRC
jgi:Fe-S oxidoreductases